MAGYITPNAITITNSSAPNVYVNVLQPTPTVQGVATNVVGVVGSASWGPLNTPTLVGSPQAYKRGFGWIVPSPAPSGSLAATANPYDGGAAVAAVFSQAGLGAALAVSFIRVSDGSDAAATHATVDTTSSPLTGGTLTALYTGSLGNGVGISIAIAAKTDGSSNVYFNVTLTPPAGYGLNAEFYPALQGTTTGTHDSPFWVNFANALANGIPGICGPSALCSLVTPSSTAKNPAVITGTLMTGGIDGVTTAADVIEAAVGSASANPYTGLFAFIGANPAPSVAVIAGLGATADDGDLSTYSATLQSFVDTSACELFLDFNLGETTAAAVTLVGTPASGGILDYNVSFLKDWAYFNDGVSGLRFYPMAPFAAGVRGITPAWNSLLNLQVKGILGTYRTIGAGLAPYSPAEIGLCNANGILLVSSPSPGGNYLGFNTGVNSSMSINTATGPEEYASMTNYLAKTFAANFGPVVGQNQSNSPVDPLRKKVRDLTNSFLTGLSTQDPPAIDEFLVTCNTTNNPPASVKAHIMTMLVAVEYLSSVWYFVIQLMGGNTVQVSVSQGS